MRNHRLHQIRAISAAAVLGIGLAFVTDASANPGGRYKTTARLPKFNGMIWGPNTPLILRLPNGKGKLNGSFKGAGTIGLMGNTPITGRVTNAFSRQGGKKYMLKGNWIWKLKQNALSGNARGRFRFLLNQIGSTYVIRDEVRVINSGTMPFTIRAKIVGRK